MALAILDLEDLKGPRAQFRIDTGTSRYYRLKAGNAVQRRNGIEWVDELVSTTPLRSADRAGDLLDSSSRVTLPMTGFTRGVAYVQLLSYKTPQGTSPAFSRVVRVPVGAAIRGDLSDDISMPFSRTQTMMAIEPFAPPRQVPCRTRDSYARAASLEDFLGQIVKVAAPLVETLLGGDQGRNAAGASQGAAGGAKAGNDGLTDALTSLLKTIFGKIGLSGTKSVALSLPATNRFAGSRSNGYAHPFIFGIDDALIGAAVGQIIQVLPQLANAANEKRIAFKKADNALMGSIAAGINKRLMMEQLIDAQKKAPSSGPGNAADLGQLIQLLQQLPEGDAAATSETKSLSAPLSLGPGVTLSARAVLSFGFGASLNWNGADRVLFSRTRPMQLKLKLSVAEPAPKIPLPKAIVRVVVRDTENQAVKFEKTFKQKNILPNGAIVLDFTQDEVARLPANRPLALLAEMRWLNSRTRKEYKALGSSEIVLVDKFYLKEPGGSVSPEQELSDLERFRSFWNKIWESPTPANGSGRTLWALDVTTRYTALLSPAQATNGLMQTKTLRNPPDPNGLTEAFEGRMKAGVELSLAELNKCVSLWSGENPLDADRLEALNTETFARRNAGDFTYPLKLKGKKTDRGIVWVVPVLKLFDFTLGSAVNSDESGQVLPGPEERVHFPLPVAARVIGLKSDPGEEAPDEENPTAYHFDGFKVEFSEKIQLVRRDG